MAARLGNALFWASVIFAALFFVAAEGLKKPFLQDISLPIICGLIVLVGWGLRYILGGNKK